MKSNKKINNKKNKKLELYCKNPWASLDFNLGVQSTVLLAVIYKQEQNAEPHDVCSDV